MGNITSIYRTIALIFILCIPVFSVCFLAGWYLNDYRLKGGLLGEGAVNPVTAASFILLSVAFLLSVTRRSDHSGKFIALPVIAISLIRLAEITFSFPSNISQIFFARQIAADFAADKPNAVAPNTAILFVLLSISILLLTSVKRVGKTLADIPASAALLISSLSVIGHLYNTPEFYFINSLVPMVPATAICFGMFALAILFYRSDSGLFSVFTSQYQGSRIARYMLPLAIIIPIAAGGQCCASVAMFNCIFRTMERDLTPKRGVAELALQICRAEQRCCTDTWTSSLVRARDVKLKLHFPK